MSVSLICASGEPREVHHFAALIGYGANAVYPYLAYESIDDMVVEGRRIDFLTRPRPTTTLSRPSTKGCSKL